jgi:hypothetical protein
MGAAIIFTTGSPQAIGVVAFLAGLTILCLTKLQKWITDTTFEKQCLRSAILNADEAARQAQVGHALQLAERERDRRAAEDVRKDAERRIATAEQRADQAEINSSMRAHAFEEACETRTTTAIAAADKRADDRIAAEVQELAEGHAEQMMSQYVTGVLHERQGIVDGILAGLEDPKLIHLDDHRRPPAEPGNAAGAPR